MSTTQRCYPDGTTATTHATVTGSADVDDALRDTSDSNYVDLTGAGTSSFDVTLQNITALGANQRVARARIVAKVGMVGSGNAHTSFNLRQSTTDHEVMFKSGVLSGTYTSDWSHVDPVTGLEYTEANINSLHMKVTDTINAGQPRFRWARMEVEIQDEPTADFSTPIPGQALAITDDPGSLGYFRWAAAPNADAIYRYRLKTFDVATVGGGGFDPETSTPIQDTGDQLYVGNNVIRIDPAGHAFDTPYYVYIKVSTLFNGGPDFGTEEWWGSWSAGRNFKTDSIPTVLVGTPSGSVNTSQPTFTWIYGDNDGKTPSSFKIRVFKSTQLPPGDDPTATTSGMIYNSPPLPADVFTHTPSNPILSNGVSYRAYIYPIMPNFSAAILASISSIGSSDFTGSWTPPATPTMTVTAEPQNGRVKGVLKNNYNDASARIFWERSDDGGVTWHSVRNAWNIDIGYNVDTTIYDNEGPPNVASQYRAYVNAVVVGVKTQSAYTTAVTVTLKTTVAWLKNPLNPAMNMHVILENDYVPRSKRVARAVFEPIGNQFPVIQKGAANYAQVGDVNLMTLTLADEAKLIALLESGDTLFLQTSRSNWYVELAGDYTVQEYPWTDRRNHKIYDRHFVCQFVEVVGVPQ